MLGRYDSYLATFVRERTPERLKDAEIGRLARFFDVEAWELGGPGERRSNRRPDQQPVRPKQAYTSVVERVR